MSELPVDPQKMREYEAIARKLFDVLDVQTAGALSGRRIGMALFLFSFSGGELTYISNAERESMIKMLLEFISKAPPSMTWDEQHG